MSADHDRYAQYAGPHENVAAWLRLIVEERFGSGLVLSWDAHGDAILLAPESPSSLIIRSNPAWYCEPAWDPPVTAWQPCPEGWDAVIEDRLPAPGYRELPSPLIEATRDGYVLHFDVLGFACWMMSRQEEVGRTDLDGHARFPASASHAFRHGYLERPLVDEWLAVVRQVVARLWPALPLAEHRFRLLVSHDVDTPSRHRFATVPQLARGMVADLLKRRDLAAAIGAPFYRIGSAGGLHPSDPLNTFDWIMARSESAGLKSAFYFICGRTHPHLDAPYEIGDPAIRGLLRRIHLRGHEIGLHPSYNTFRSPERVTEEASRLRQVCREEAIDQPAWGGRMHFLRWETPTTLYGWSAAGMDYDSSLGYADHPGFRCGTCFEYPAFDPVARKMLPLRIRPLIAMECTILASRYLGLGTGDAALQKFTDLKSRCRAVSGAFTLLWHNAELIHDDAKSLYRRLLA